MANLVQEVELQRLQLKPDEEVIVKAYCNPKLPTCGNQSLSYKQARTVKESALTVISSKFFQRSKIKNAVQLYQDFYHQKIERTEQGAKDRELAFLIVSRESLIERDPINGKISSKDWPSVLNCTEKICKLEGIMNDKIEIDIGFQRVLDQLAGDERPLLTEAIADRMRMLGSPGVKRVQSHIKEHQEAPQGDGDAVSDAPIIPDYAR